MPSDDDHPLLKVSEVAAALRVSPTTIYDMIAKQRLPHLKLTGAGCIRVRRVDLEQYLEEARQNGSAVS